MAVTRRAYAGAAAATTLSAGISNVDTSISITAATGWPSGNPFFAVIEPGLGGEEKILCTRSGTTLTASTRGADNTSAASHSSGVEIYPCLTATDLDEANRLAAAMTTEGDIIVADASGNPIRLARGTTGQVLEATASTVAWGQVDTAGIADLAVTAAKIAANTITAAEIATNAVGASELADNAVDTAAIANANVTLAKIASEAWTPWTPQIDQGASINIAKTVNYARYQKVGRKVSAAFDLALTAGGSAGSAFTITTPPFAFVGGTLPPRGSGYFFDAAGTIYPFIVVFSAAQTVYFWSVATNTTTSDDGLGADVNSFNFALASGDQIRGFFEYESST